MLKRTLFFLALILNVSSLFATPSDGKTVLLAILARNKAHVLPKFFECIDAQEYDKSLITIYINTNNNEDETESLLTEWKEKNKHLYRNIIFETHNVDTLPNTDPHKWTAERFSVLGRIRNKSLQMAKEHNTDYYFVVDCDNFIAPFTLKTLIEKDKPIIAPMLKPVPEPGDPYRNYFTSICENGYWKNDSAYWKILNHTKVGTFNVPVVHCTYLIKSEYIDRLTYVDGTQHYEFVIFSKSARDAGIGQYICNEKEFGTLIHMCKKATLEQEKEVVTKLYG